MITLSLMESAEDLPIPEGSVDMIVTDPPYYDDVQYAEISDFFYALIKPVLHDVFPDKFPSLPYGGKDLCRK